MVGSRAASTSCSTWSSTSACTCARAEARCVRRALVRRGARGRREATVVGGAIPAPKPPGRAPKDHKDSDRPKVWDPTAGTSPRPVRTRARLAPWHLRRREGMRRRQGPARRPASGAAAARPSIPWPGLPRRRAAASPSSRRRPSAARTPPSRSPPARRRPAPGPEIYPYSLDIHDFPSLSAPCKAYSHVP